MNEINLGYACICQTLREKGIFTNRTMRKKTFQDKGLEYVSDLALLNVKDLKTIVEWNNAKGIDRKSVV